MRVKNGATLALATLCGAAASVTNAQTTVVVPNVYTSTQASTSGLNTFIRDSGNPRTAQILINANQLTTVVGQQLTGITWRLWTGSTVAYPASNATWADYTINVGTGVAFGSQTTTFAANFVGAPTTVRSGPLTINAGLFPGAGGPPRAFGPTVTFTTPFLYTGGNLLIEARHTGSSIVNNAANDFLEVALTTDPGFNTNFWSATATGNTATVGAAANFSVSQLTFVAAGVTGACCLPNGNCITTSQAVCTNQGGAYQGDNVLCNQVTCPQPGACCLSNSTCTVLSSAQCAAQSGVYQGNGSSCAVAGCPTMGACCLFDGSCLLVSAAGCAAQGGVYSGNATVCGSVNCPQPTCYSATGLSVAIADGGVPTNGTAGPDADATMVVAAPGTINGILAGVQITHTFQGDVGFKLVHPDGTNLMLANRPGVTPPKNNGTSATFGFGNDNFGNPTTGVYMKFLGSASTPYDDAIGEPGPPAGTATAVDNPVGNWKPTAGGNLNTTFNGKPVAGTWHLIANDYAGGDVGSVNAFQICVGAATAVCYPNCDHSTTAPCLNVQDFGCFLNAFASGDTYANCDASTTPPVLNVQDFGCFLNSFANGCSNC